MSSKVWGETCQYRRAITKSLITAQNQKKGTTPLLEFMVDAQGM